MTLYIRYIKRPIDFALAFVSLMIAGPILLFVALLVRTTSQGPVFYRGVRAGRNDTTFRIFKFRTMVENAETIGGPSTALNDPRLTPVGRFLRKFKLDELPQLFNILSGDMSFVGPRPQVLKYTSLYDGEFRRILDLRPGLTDYASIEFIDMDKTLGDGDVDQRYLKEIEPRKNELRLKYVNDASFSVDIRILIKTFLRLIPFRRTP
jgi:lipopolysaccharide/colanic/teichoic acid biosynthesis glycosyltransferase